MPEEIAVLERTGTWGLVSPPPGVRPITCKWVYKIKPALMDLLSAIKRVLWLVAFSRSRAVTMMRLLLLWLIWPLCALVLLSPLFTTGLCLILMFRMPFSMVSYVRRFICSLLQGILFLMGWSAVFGALFMA
jgi:hypothetical protein